jgi:hypothetical protein
MKTKNIIIWGLKIIPAIIMLQTLYFKFSAAASSVRLFTILGMEPWGRIGIGVMELIASVLLLYPLSSGFGAIMGLGLMAGAIFFHITKLGINFDGDPLLFIYAVIVFICCSILSLIYLKELLAFVSKVTGIKNLLPA